MMRPQARVRSLVILVALVTASLACTVDVGGPVAPGPSIPVSQDAAAILEDVWASALQGALATGQVLVILDEAQVTSLLAIRLSQQDKPVLTNPQVYLQDGQIRVYGSTIQGPLRGNVLIAIEPRLDTEGRVTFDVLSADFGPVPAPASVLDGISSVLTELFTGSLGSLATGVRVTSLAIDDGEMSIVGELR